jgi:Fe-S-cluster containining protein
MASMTDNAAKWQGDGQKMPYGENGHLMTSNDMARVDGRDCEGCDICCHGMGDTIKINPYDAFLLMKNLHKSFDELTEICIDFSVDDGLILPYMRMTGEDEHCVFLGENGRCSIHDFRTCLCRLFPLGRDYDCETHEMRYFVLEGACRKKNLTKIKIKKWLGTPQLEKNEAFLKDWHYFIKAQKVLAASAGSEERMKQISMKLLNTFYRCRYDLDGDFYAQYERAKDTLY